MAILVVGGSGRGVGKTALVCGLIAALPEFRWTGVKITTDDHGMGEPIWEETDPGQGSDTARYLSAGAVRALLVTAPMSDFSNLLFELWAKLGLCATGKFVWPSTTGSILIESPWIEPQKIDA